LKEFIILERNDIKERIMAMAAKEDQLDLELATRSESTSLSIRK